MNPFARFDRPWLAALGAAGGVWFVASLVLGLVASGLHPTLDLLVFVLHGLGVAALVGAGVVYGLLFWKDYFDTKFAG